MKELIVWIILLNIDGIMSTLLMLILAYICMFLQHKKRIQDWITSLSGIQIGAYLLVCKWRILRCASSDSIGAL